jgi:hypothetical protein
MEGKMNKEQPLKEFILKYEKPKILLLDLPEETLSVVQSAGFNVVSGTFGTPYKVEPDNRYLPIIPNANLPEDYTEKEVIIIDLTLPEKRVTFPAGTGMPGNENRFWFQCKQDIIDPRSVKMMEVNDNFERIFKFGGLFVIFAQPRFAQTVYQVKDGHINIDQPKNINNWDFLLIFRGFGINEDYGKEIEVLEGDSQIFSFLKKNIDGAHYEAVLEKPDWKFMTWTPLLKSKFQKDIGTLIEFQDVPGRILILPQMLKRSEVIATLLKEILPEISPHLFPYAESNHWIKADEYELDPILEIKARKIEIQKKAQEEVEELDKLIEDERNKFDFLQGILSSTGRDLVVNIKKCLEFIGFVKVVDVDEEIKNGDIETLKQEDLQIFDESPTLLIEVKGLTGVPQEADILQVVKYSNRRMQEWNRTDVHGVSIINHQRNLPPLIRGNAFTPQQEKDAKGNDITILTTWDLFLLTKGAMKWKWDYKIIRELLYNKGRTSRIPSIYKPLGKIVHYWDDIGVVGVEVSENEIHKGQYIGYITPTGYLEEEVTSLQINNEDVDKASLGQTVGIKTLYSKKQLGKAKVYIVKEGEKSI